MLRVEGLDSHELLLRNLIQVTMRVRHTCTCVYRCRNGELYGLLTMLAS